MIKKRKDTDQLFTRISVKTIVYVHFKAY